MKAYNEIRKLLVEDKVNPKLIHYLDCTKVAFGHRIELYNACSFLITFLGIEDKLNLATQHKLEKLLKEFKENIDGNNPQC